jgi:hypothetical protein
MSVRRYEKNEFENRPAMRELGRTLGFLPFLAYKRMSGSS